MWHCICVRHIYQGKDGGGKKKKKKTHNPLYILQAFGQGREACTHIHTLQSFQICVFFVDFYVCHIDGFSLYVCLLSPPSPPFFS